MEETRRCRECILPASLPSAGLEGQGTCSLCGDYLKRKAEHQATGRNRIREFEAHVKRAKGLKRPYDCLVPLSGGKDSTYALYLCDRVYGMKCLAVTFDNGFLSPHAIANIRNAVRSTRADHMMISTNRPTMLKLYRLFLEKTGTFCPACMRGIGLALNVAQLYKIPLTVSGTGWQVTYLAGVPEVFQEGSVDFVKNVVKGEPIEKDISALLQGNDSWGFDRLYRIAGRLFKRPWLARSMYVRLYDYFDPDYDKIYDIIKREMGWTAGDEANAEHLDCELHGVAGYLHSLKFPELTGHTIHRAGLVRMGKADRDIALAEDLKEKANFTPPAGLKPFLDEMGMSIDEFLAKVKDWRTVTRFRSKKKNPLRSLYHKLSRQ
jgi:hypothetical protein